MRKYFVIYEDNDGANWKTGPLSREEAKEYFNLLVGCYRNVQIIYE